MSRLTKLKKPIQLSLVVLAVISCQNATTSKTDLSDSVINETNSMTKEAIDDSHDHAACKIDSNSIGKYKDVKYTHHVTIFKILNGSSKEKSVDGKLITMFQYSLFPDEDSMYFHLTNKVVTDLVVKSQQKFYLDFNYNHTPFDHYEYFMYHLEHPKCLNVPFYIYRDSVQQKLVATSDSAILIKNNLMNRLNN